MYAIPDPGSPHDPSSTTPLDSVQQQPTWADIIGDVLDITPAWVLAATIAILLITAALTFPVARQFAHMAGKQAANKTSDTGQALLIAALTPASLMWLATLIGSFRGLTAFGRDTLHWRNGWDWLVPGTLDGVGITFAFLAFRAVRMRRNPDRSIRVAWGAMAASATINFSHEAGVQGGSYLGGIYLGLLSVFAMLIFHELLDQFEEGAEWIQRYNPKFGLRWLTWPTNTACAWVAWRNYPPAEGTRPTIPAAIDHLDQVRAEKRRKKAERIRTELAAPWWVRAWPWARVSQLDAALAEHRSAVEAERARQAAIADRLEQTEQALAAAEQQAEQYVQQFTAAVAERETEQANVARAEQVAEQLRRDLSERSEQMHRMQAEHAAQLAALRAEQARRSAASNSRQLAVSSEKPARAGRAGAPKLTDAEAIALMLEEHPERDYEWGSREVHRLTGAGFGRIPKLIAAVAEQHQRSAAPERSERSADTGAEQAGTAVSA